MPKTKYEKQIEKYTVPINRIGNTGIEGSEKLKTAFQNLVTEIEEIKEEKLDNAERTETVVAGLCKLYSDCMKAVEEYEDANKDNVLYSKEDREKMRKIKIAIGKDVTALNNYQKAQKENVSFVPKNFETILEEGRAKTITVKSSDVGIAAAGQSERMVFSDEEKKDTVYFTESKPGKSLNAQIKDMMDGIKKKYGGKANCLYNNNVMNAFKTMATNRKALLSASNPLLSQQDRLNSLAGSFMDDENVFNVIRNLDTSDEKEIFFECVEKLSKITLAVDLNKSNGIRQDSKQDKRNSAMSMTADLLGMGDIIAHSENTRVNFKNQSGTITKTVMGTAMAQALGVDRKEAGLPYDVSAVIAPENNFRNYSLSAIENNKNFIRDVARLQILDYICGNPDRHAANLLYKFDTNGKIVGLQGIDNDTSFGSKFVPGTNRSVALNHMQVIPKSTADMIEATNEDTFRLMLYGYDLTKKEVDAAIERLDLLKDVIKNSKEIYQESMTGEGILINGVPRVVDDDKLGEYSVEKQLAVNEVENGKKKHHNTFSMLAASANPVTVTMSLMENNMDKAKETTNEFLRVGMLAMQKSYMRLDSVDKWYHTGSKEYTNMKKGIENVVNDVKKYEGCFLEEKEKLGNLGSDHELSALAKKMKKDIKNAIDATNTYINGKNKVMESNDPKDLEMKQKLADKESRTYKRYQNALTNRRVLEAQYERFVKIETYLAQRRALAADTKTIDEIKEKDEKARRIADQKLKNNQLKDEVNRYCKNQEKIINDMSGKVSDNKKISAVIDHAVLNGLMPVALKSMKQVVAEKDKNPKQFDNFKLAVAACIIGDKLRRQEQQNGDNAIKSNREPNQNDYMLAKMKAVDTDKIKNVDSFMQSLTDFMKSEAFNTTFDKIVKESQELPHEYLLLYTNQDQSLKNTTLNKFAEAFRNGQPEPEKVTTRNVQAEPLEKGQNGNDRICRKKQQADDAFGRKIIRANHKK